MQMNYGKYINIALVVQLFVVVLLFICDHLPFIWGPLGLSCPLFFSSSPLTTMLLVKMKWDTQALIIEH